MKRPISSLQGFIKTSPLLRVQYAAMIGVVFVVCWSLSNVIANEIPMGSVRGQILVAESHQPLPGATVYLTPIDSRGNRSTTRWTTSINKGKFVFPLVRTGEYRISAESTAHSVSGSSITVIEGKTTHITLSLSRSEPNINLVQHQYVYTTKETAYFSIRGYVDWRTWKARHRDQVEVKVYRGDLRAIIQDRDAANDLSSMSQSETTPGIPDEVLHPVVNHQLAPPAKLVIHRTYPIRRTDIEGFYYHHVRIGKLPPGLYLVSAQHGRRKVGGWLLVTDMALVVKTAAHQLVAFVADINNGSPVADAQVQVYRKGAVIAQGISDDRGLVNLRTPLSQGNSAWTAIATKSSDQAVVGLGDMSTEGQGRYVVAAYTDRPIYRPGQRIYFKGIVRRVLQYGVKYAVAERQPVKITVRDPLGDRVFRTRLLTNSYGSYADHFDLPSEASTGAYTMITTVDGEKSTHDILIAAYRKPEFTLKATPSQPRYFIGQTAHVLISAQYYFGVPLANAVVSYQVYRSPDFSYGYTDLYGYSSQTVGQSSQSEDYGQTVIEGKVTLNSKGQYDLQFPAVVPKAPDSPQVHDFTVNLDITDAAGNDISSQCNFQVVAAAFSLSINPEGYLANPHQPFTVTVSAQDYNGKPVPNAPITLTTGYESWARDNSIYRRAAASPTGQNPLFGITGPDGNATFTLLPPKNGELRITARSYDSQHRGMVAWTDVWVCSDEGGDMENQYTDLSLMTNKRNYQPGDKARVLVTCAKPGETVLLTVEGDKVYQAFLVPMVKRSAIVYVPIKAVYGPNVFLDGCYIRKKHYATSEVPLRVSIMDRIVNVNVRAGRQAPHGPPPVYRPGQKITFHIWTSDMKGRPIPAELSFGVVDEAIYALQEDNPQVLIDHFYPQRTNSVNTTFSFAIEYLGDVNKAEPSIKVRKRFLDTAYWNPFIRTDQRGQATVKFTLPDNLTTWRATALAVTRDTRVGRTTDRVIVSKPFMVQVETPRFLVQGDHSRILAFIHNNTSSPQSAMVQLAVNGLNAVGTLTQSVAIGSGEMATVIWPVDATSIGNATITVKAWTQFEANQNPHQYTDGVQISLPVSAHGRDLLRGSAGVVKAGAPAETSVYLSPHAIASDTTLTLRITPSISSSLVGALKYLIGYPYGCTEQTMSRFLPDLLVQRLLREKNHPNKAMEAELPRMVNESLLRLYRFQHDTGAWGWWRHDNDDPWMTAYVLYGLAQAKRLGYPVSHRALAKAKLGAVQLLRTMPLNDRVFMLYALDLAGDRKDVKTEMKNLNLIPRPSHHRRQRKVTIPVSTQSLAYTILLEHRLGMPDRGAWKLLEQMEVSHDQMIHWRVSYNSSSWEYDWDNVMVTAAALQAILVTNPHDPRIEPILRWLMFQRTGECWWDTRDTSWVLAAFVRYLKTQPPMKEGGSVLVSVNGRAIRRFDITPSEQWENELALKLPVSQLTAGRNAIALQRSGGNSPIFYTVQLKQMIAMKHIPALIYKNMVIKREYLRIIPQKVGQFSWNIQTVPTHNQMRQDDQIRVRLVMVVPRNLEYVIIEDHFPAGCEVTERGSAGETSGWDYWWSNVNVRDKKIVFFATNIPAGIHTIEYNLRARTPGIYHALPAMIQEMYSPEVLSETAETRVSVTERK